MTIVERNSLWIAFRRKRSYFFQGVRERVIAVNYYLQSIFTDSEEAPLLFYSWSGQIESLKKLIVQKKMHFLTLSPSPSAASSLLSHAPSDGDDDASDEDDDEAFDTFEEWINHKNEEGVNALLAACATGQTQVSLFLIFSLFPISRLLIPIFLLLFRVFSQLFCSFLSSRYSASNCCSRKGPTLTFMATTSSLRSFCLASKDLMRSLYCASIHSFILVIVLSSCRLSSFS